MVLISSLSTIGAITILREQNNIDFAQLMCGKLGLSDLPRVKDVASMEKIRLPYFMQPMCAYRTRLRQIARLNGIAVSVVNADAAPNYPFFSSSPLEKNLKTSHGDGFWRSVKDSRNTNQLVSHHSLLIHPVFSYPPPLKACLLIKLYRKRGLVSNLLHKKVGGSHMHSWKG